MCGEFSSYGLPTWFMWLIGALKLVCAAAFILSIWFSQLISTATLVLAVLICGAIAMHYKARDPLLKFIPAGIIIILSIAIAALESLLEDHKKVGI